MEVKERKYKKLLQQGKSEVKAKEICDKWWKEVTKA